jgi:hypothetical protein
VPLVKIAGHVVQKLWLLAPSKGHAEMPFQVGFDTHKPVFDKRNRSVIDHGIVNATNLTVDNILSSGGANRARRGGSRPHLRTQPPAEIAVEEILGYEQAKSAKEVGRWHG